MDGKSIRRFVAFSGLFLMLAVGSGCTGIAAQLGWMIYGRYEQPEYKGLKGKRVAIVVNSDASAYGPNTMTKTLAAHIGVYLTNNVKDIDVVRQADIENWKDNNNFEISDYVELGNAMNADRVVAVEVGSYSLAEGQTLLKGRANISVSVYDLEKNGMVVYLRSPEDFEFPKTHARPRISTEEKRFESVFLQIMAEDISKRFYKHEVVENYAIDGTPVN